MKRINKLALAVSMVTYGGVASAAVEDAGHVTWGGMDVTPLLTTDLVYNDNVFSNDDDATPELQEKSSWIYVIAPSVEFKAVQGMSSYALTLGAETQQYTSEDDASFTDYGADLALDHEFNSRNRLSLTGNYGTYHEGGSTRSGEDDKKAPEYVNKALDLTYGFGSTEAIARVDFFGSYNSKEYDKTEDKDKTTDELGMTVYNRFMPKTDVLFEIKRRNLDYDDETVEDAGFEVNSVLVGVNWEATAKTTGYVKVGRRYRDSKAPGVDEEDFTGWEVGVSYLPLEHSLIQISSTQDYGLEADDPSSASFTKGTQSSVYWMHDWTSKISTNLSYSYTDDEIQGVDGVTTKDRATTVFGAGLSWKAQRNLTVTLNWENTDKDEKAKQDGVSESDYKKNVYTLSAEWAI